MRLTVGKRELLVRVCDFERGGKEKGKEGDSTSVRAAVSRVAAVGGFVAEKGQCGPRVMEKGRDSKNVMGRLSRRGVKPNLRGRTDYRRENRNRGGTAPTSGKGEKRGGAETIPTNVQRGGQARNVRAARRTLFPGGKRERGQTQREGEGKLFERLS